MRVTEQNYHEVLTPGRTVYKAYKLGTLDFFIEEIATTGIFIHTFTEWAGAVEVDSDVSSIPMSGHIGYFFSLRDAGILPNSYNQHQTFTTRQEAEEYLRGIK